MKSMLLVLLLSWKPSSKVSLTCRGKPRSWIPELQADSPSFNTELGPGTVAAFFAETVVGATSGCTTAVPGYFKAIREVCDRYGTLFCLDEIMCGIGRTGKMHAWEWEGVKPDIQTCGKGMAGG